MKEKDLDLYTDYLLSINNQATATGLSAVLENEISHDYITRFLSKSQYTSKELWLNVKNTVRKIEAEDAVLIFDDSIQEKASTDESEQICYHFDHTKGKNVKGLNILNALYHANDISIPIGFEIVKKPLLYCDLKDKNTGKVKRKSEITKNDYFREMFKAAVKNQLKFKYVLMDSWFGAVDNFEYILKYKKHFITAIKSNRLVALSVEDKKRGKFIHVNDLELSDKQSIKCYLKGLEQPVLIVRQIFTNKNESIGVLNLVCSDLSIDGESVATIYKKRWKVEEFHKSLKQNAGLAKSPTRTVITQNNHVFMSIFAVFKLECLKITHCLNHFALKTKLLLKANQIALAELRILKSA
jgi:hypothetical protein